MNEPNELLRLAHSIDDERATQLSRDFGAGSVRELGVLLGAAFPPLSPTVGWQFDALEGIFRERWRVRRRLEDIVSRIGTGARHLDPEARLVALRRVAWAEKARVALRELLPHQLGGAPLDVTARELSRLADATLEMVLGQAAVDVADRFGAPRRRDGRDSKLVAIGLGKLGGLELNPGSDVDIVFFYDTDEGGGELSLHDHWTRVTRRAVAAMEALTADGQLWPVDLRLRPEGSQGPIVNSVQSAERYYETWGRLWERAALLRARRVAGDADLGRSLDRELFIPFVYRREVDPSIATAMAELVQRSRVELSPDPARDLKHGPGGIREAEFFVQSLQLIWGGREASVRVTGTLAALGRLRSRGLVSDREAQQIAEAYLLLRRLEHRVQWMSGVRTHLLPEHADEYAKLARTLGLDDSEKLRYEIDRARTIVSELFASLAPFSPRPPSRYQVLLSALDHGQSESALMAAEQVFSSGEIGEHLMALSRRPNGLLGALTRERFPHLSDQILDAIFGSSDPEQAARSLRNFFGRFLDPSGYIGALGEEEQALRRMVTVFGASAFIGDALVARPDLADRTIFSGAEVPDPRVVVSVELETAERDVHAAQDREGRRAAFVAALRRAKSQFLVDVAMADLDGTLGTREATRLLSEMADQQLERATRFEMGEPVRGLAVIAMGKLGGSDIGYASDLDVLFVYDPDAAPSRDDALAHFARRAQRIIRLISEPHDVGPGYELDTRLRPSGSHGMLVTTAASFARYHGVGTEAAAGETQLAVLASGAAWERQALLRARACAGDLELGARAIRIAEVAAYELGAPAPEELHRLRMRMQRELGRERPRRYDIKTGEGGLLDIEFAVQWLQMRFGQDRSLRTTDTGNALEALHRGSYLEIAHYATLLDGYRFLRRLEQRMVIQGGASSTVLDLRRPGLAQVARRMGLQDTPGASARELLMSRYLDIRGAVRAAYRDILGVPPD